ncbi:DNA recombination protein rmuC [Serratia rubidaea]|nr:DNA recombination protein rmuC [Serratia rubidaea]
MNKLSEGRGNLIGQTEGFRALGVEVKRPINPQLAQQASEQERQDAQAADDAAGALPGAEAKDATDPASQG